MIIPIHVGTVESFTIIFPVATEAFVGVPVEVPSDVDAFFNSFRTINPIAKTLAPKNHCVF